MRIRSFAKINLGLEVVRRRPDRYHEIRTLFQSIGLADEIVFEPAPKGVLTLDGDDPAIPWDENNLILKAARLLQARTGSTLGAAIRVRKKIPPGKGLGGGSSNAAAALSALNELWGLALGPADLAEMALAAGSDVPYFLYGGLCLGEGRGEALTPLTDLAPHLCVLALPPYPISTPEIYAGYGPFLTSAAKASKINRFLETGDFGLLENDLEQVIFQTHPELEGYKRFFRDQGAVLTQVSGSGSAVYGLFPDGDSARAAFGRLRAKAAAVMTETLPREAYWAHVGAGV